METIARYKLELNHAEEDIKRLRRALLCWRVLTVVLVTGPLILMATSAIEWMLVHAISLPAAIWCLISHSVRTDDLSDARDRARAKEIRLALAQAQWQKQLLEGETP
ncbi:hypothetical protein CPHO_08425 [Corynebacterium phocae]|uniref:Uncharacterized protein n=1 Tax=Corynebacterium phocae TaxID=161895 RepID=A0A1L7D458_9CORY|nr:hypothetical protein [Corynebacterium phocae]APT92908.1 hypothetical protein CPHO_08425 [Corynebacterium phocae]KAA8723232.1 hypothetical protein F4V58_07920 [Corynebacterium phocae]